MKRSAVALSDAAEWHNLATAFYRAARATEDREAASAFAADLFGELTRLREVILQGTVAVGKMSRFQIRDPKPRIIHAPCFRERVLHHALMAQVGPVLDRTLVFDTYACRVGKGALAAVRRAWQHARRHPWHAKIDVRGYFASIDQARLKTSLARRLKDRGLLALLARIIDAHHVAPGKGLPIGALTSQHFANYYLAGLDRLLLEHCRVGGMVRYMDDVVWWGESREAVSRALQVAGDFLQTELLLAIKEPAVIGRSAAGVSLCGYRVLPEGLRLSRRRRRRYSAIRRRWERTYARGEVDALALQAGYATALDLTAHVDAAPWRREQLRRSPLEETLAAL